MAKNKNDQTQGGPADDLLRQIAASAPAGGTGSEADAGAADRAEAPLPPIPPAVTMTTEEELNRLREENARLKWRANGGVGAAPAGEIPVGGRVTVAPNRTADPLNRSPKVNSPPPPPFLVGPADAPYSFEAHLEKSPVIPPVRFRSFSHHALELTGEALTWMGVSNTTDRVIIRRLSEEESQASLAAEAAKRQADAVWSAEARRLRDLEKQKDATFAGAGLAPAARPTV